MLRVNHLSCSYENESETKVVVKDANFILEDGKIYDLTGPSGSGKSTILKALAKLIPRDSGEFILDGKNSKDIKNTIWRREVCLFMQTTSLIDASVFENLLLPFSYKVRQNSHVPNQGEMREVLDALLLEDVDLEHNAHKLSGGQQARIAFARNYLTKPKVMLLDEVDASLDSKSADALWELVDRAAREGSSVLRIRHKDDDGRGYRRFYINNAKLEELDRHE